MNEEKRDEIRELQEQLGVFSSLIEEMPFDARLNLLRVISMLAECYLGNSKGVLLLLKDTGPDGGEMLTTAGVNCTYKDSERMVMASATMFHQNSKDMEHIRDHAH